jgi:hypothetical protein
VNGDFTWSFKEGTPSGVLRADGPIPSVQLTPDYAVQRPDGEVLGIYVSRREAEDNRPPGANVVMRWSSSWSKPLT